MKSKNRHNGQNRNSQNGNTQRGNAPKHSHGHPPARFRHNPNQGVVSIPIPKAFAKEIHAAEEAASGKKHELQSLAGAFHSMSQVLMVAHPDGMFTLLTGIVPTDDELFKAVNDRQSRVRKNKVRLRDEMLHNEGDRFAVVTIYKLPSGMWFTTTILDGHGKESRPTMNMPMIRSCHNRTWFGILSKWTGMHWDVNSQQRYHMYRKLPLGVYTALFDTIEAERELIRTRLTENQRMTFEELVEFGSNLGGHSVVDPSFHDDEDPSVEAVDPEVVLDANRYAPAVAQ